MATLQEAIEAVRKPGWRVTKDGEEYVWCPVHNRLEKFYSSQPVEPVYVSEDNLSGWTIEEPVQRFEPCVLPELPSNVCYREPQSKTYEVEIDWCRTTGGVPLWFDPRDIVPYRWPLYELETTNRLLGYIFDGLEDLPDDHLPQQPRVWVLKAAYCPGYYVKRWLADAPLPGSKGMYELRRAKAVRLRR